MVVAGAPFRGRLEKAKDDGVEERIANASNLVRRNEFGQEREVVEALLMTRWRMAVRGSGGCLEQTIKSDDKQAMAQRRIATVKMREPV